MIKLHNLKNKVLDGLMLRKRGSQTLDFLIIALIVVIVGAALMGVMRIAMPQLFQDVINMITGSFTI